MKTGLTLALAVIAVIVGSKYTGIRKGLVTERAAIEGSWEQVNTALDERAALVGDLVQVVQREAPGETAAIRAATDARMALHASAGPPQKIQANTALDTALARLLLCIENYPKLESSREYDHLEEALKEAEDRIAVERRKYNEAVEHYNARIALFPDNLVASLAGFGKIDAYFQTRT